MQTLRFCLALSAVALVAGGLSPHAGSADISTFTTPPPRPRGIVSGRPVRMTIALNAAGTRSLSLVFDEYKGTRAGYDRVWADLDGDGRFEAEEMFVTYADPSDDYTAVEEPKGMVESEFPPLLLQLNAADRKLRVPPPDTVRIWYERDRRHDLFKVVVDTTVHDRRGCWQYSVFGVYWTKGKTRVPWGLDRRPDFGFYTKPDRYRDGYAQISAMTGLRTAALGARRDEPDLSVLCLRDGVPTPINFTVTGANGKPADCGIPRPSNFGMGSWVQFEDYILRLPRGKYRVRGTCDAGPIFGVLTAEERVKLP